MDFDSVPHCDEIRLVKRGLGKVGFLYGTAAGCFFLKRFFKFFEILDCPYDMFHILRI